MKNQNAAGFETKTHECLANVIESDYYIVCFTELIACSIRDIPYTAVTVKILTSKKDGSGVLIAISRKHSSFKIQTTLIIFLETYL